ncbi:MAG: hypothetical protein IPF92_15565 [Myxococcales bacterium]|nr:hypothetical protein [Myxococcales bacterium]
MAVEALQAFVTLVEVLASSPEELAQVDVVLAPVDGILDKIVTKREKPKGAAMEPGTPGTPEAAPASVG